MNKDAKYWDNRARTHRHTGWANSIIYAFDQQARIIAIKKALESLDICKSLALDFGAGSGDFSKLLAGYFENVYAFDISSLAIKIAQEKYSETKNIRFFSGCDLREMNILPCSLDLILSVTVLDHILDNVKLVDILGLFNSYLKGNGYVVALEYSLDHEKPAAQHQRFMRLLEWKSFFVRCGFQFCRYYGFYHPIEMPSETYLRYRKRVNNLKGRMISTFYQLIGSDRLISYLNKAASLSINNDEDFIWESENKDSILKIMIFKKGLGKDS